MSVVAPSVVVIVVVDVAVVLFAAVTAVACLLAVRFPQDCAQVLRADGVAVCGPLTLGRAVSFCRHAVRCRDLAHSVSVANALLADDDQLRSRGIALSLVEVVQPSGHPVVRRSLLRIVSNPKAPTGADLSPLTVVVRGCAVYVHTSERTVRCAGVVATARLLVDAALDALEWAS